MLKKTLPILLISLIAVKPILADDKAVNLVKDQPAPYSGVLIPPAKAQEMKEQLIEYDNLKLINESYKRSIELYKSNELSYNDKIDKINTQNDTLAKQLNSSREVSEWTRFGYFMLGVLGTVSAGYVVKKVTQ